MVEEYVRDAQIQTFTKFHQQVAIVGCIKRAWTITRHIWPNDVVFWRYAEMQSCIQIIIDELGSIDYNLTHVIEHVIEDLSS